MSDYNTLVSAEINGIIVWPDRHNRGFPPKMIHLILDYTLLYVFFLYYIHYGYYTYSINRTMLIVHLGYHIPEGCKTGTSSKRQGLAVARI